MKNSVGFPSRFPGCLGAWGITLASHFGLVKTVKSCSGCNEPARIFSRSRAGKPMVSRWRYPTHGTCGHFDEVVQRMAPLSRICIQLWPAFLHLISGLRRNGRLVSMESEQRG
eukprot:9289475-Pyramimonas_sp.AAC.1